MRELATVDVPGGTTGLALTPDGTILVVATRVGLAAVSTASLLAGTRGKRSTSCAIRTLRAPIKSCSRPTAATRSQPTPPRARSASREYRLIRRRRCNTCRTSRSTVRPTASRSRPTARRSASWQREVARQPRQPAFLARNDPRIGRASCPINLGWNGVLSAVSAQKAIDDPANAVISRIAAGCAPARVAVSPDGNVVWVSVRGEGRIFAYGAPYLREPEHALLASVAVGPAPIGLAYSSDGAFLLVANSAGGADSDDAQAASLSVVDVRTALDGAKGALRATIPTEKLAREVLSASGRVFLVTIYGAKAVDDVRLSLERNDPT